MDYFLYQQGQLFAEETPVAQIAASVGTPCYIYSRATIERHWRAFDQAFGTHPHLICYAVKANSNLAVLNVLARLGSGFDIVSGGELERVVAAGGDPGKVVFSGVGKRRDELERALELGIRCFNVESEAELAVLEKVAAARGQRAPVSLRINPDVDAETHPYIATGLKQNKFGIAADHALAVYRQAAASPHLRMVGMDCHIGSQLTQIAPFVAALQRLLALAKQLKAQGIALHHLDLGGGLGIRYRDEEPPSPATQAAALLEQLRAAPYEILIEPGRAIVGNAGILVTRVELLKSGVDKHFAVVDAAMNDLLRPALYAAWQDIIAVEPRANGLTRLYDVVGPICETGDFLGKDRELTLEPGDLLAVRSAGAYGFAMSSNYNSRPRAAEVMVDGDRFQVVRWRETLADLYAGESLLA
ncbi:MAG: diaminopimelate decarboxylase [Candidatus Contendobacter sp.]